MGSEMCIRDSTGATVVRLKTPSLVVADAVNACRCPPVGVTDCHRPYEGVALGDGGVRGPRLDGIVNGGNGTPDRIPVLPSNGSQHQWTHTHRG